MYVDRTSIITMGYSESITLEDVLKDYEELAPDVWVVVYVYFLNQASSRKSRLAFFLIVGQILLDLI